MQFSKYNQLNAETRITQTFSNNKYLLILIPKYI